MNLLLLLLLLGWITELSLRQELLHKADSFSWTGENHHPHTFLFVPPPPCLLFSPAVSSHPTFIILISWIFFFLKVLQILHSFHGIILCFYLLVVISVV